jgi:hypothetical protein
MTVNTNPVNWWKILEISLALNEALFSMLNFTGEGGSEQAYLNIMA